MILSSCLQVLGLPMWVTTLRFVFFLFLSIKFLNFSPCNSNCSIKLLTTDTIFVSKELERPKCLQEWEVTLGRDKNKHWIHPYPVYLTYIQFSLKIKTKATNRSVTKGIVYTCGDMPFLETGVLPYRKVGFLLKCKALPALGRIRGSCIHYHLQPVSDFWERISLSSLGLNLVLCLLQPPACWDYRSLPYVLTFR